MPLKPPHELALGLHPAKRVDLRFFVSALLYHAKSALHVPCSRSWSTALYVWTQTNLD